MILDTFGFPHGFFRNQTPRSTISRTPCGRRRCGSRCPEDFFFRWLGGAFNVFFLNTPWKINMEHNHRGLVQIIFLSFYGWFVCSSRSSSRVYSPQSNWEMIQIWLWFCLFKWGLVQPPTISMSFGSFFCLFVGRGKRSCLSSHDLVPYPWTLGILAKTETENGEFLEALQKPCEFRRWTKKHPNRSSFDVRWSNPLGGREGYHKSKVARHLHMSFNPWNKLKS